MARTNMTATRVKPDVDRLLTAEVVRRERISPSFVRVTLGGGDITAFAAMGYDQWFRLFLPVSEKSLTRLPNKLDTLSYLRFLTISRTDRPVLRNYTVRDHRPASGELDVDFVLHGSIAGGTTGPAATWADTCLPGDPVALLDEGIAFHPAAERARHVALVADETALPAAAGILASLPADATGTAVVEVPEPGDVQDLRMPVGVAVTWVFRRAPHDVPGRAAIAAATELATPGDGYGWVAGEQSLATSMRRHWVGAGMPKDAVSFCGYWRRRAAH